jgi:hypothetical protein
MLDSFKKRENFGGGLRRSYCIVGLAFTTISSTEHIFFRPAGLDFCLSLLLIIYKLS